MTLGEKNDNASVLQMKTREKFFSFTVKTEFESKHRFDQCGVVLYLDSEKRVDVNEVSGRVSWRQFGNLCKIA